MIFVFFSLTLFATPWLPIADPPGLPGPQLEKPKYCRPTERTRDRVEYMYIMATCSIDIDLDLRPHLENQQAIVVKYVLIREE